jgi:hypothetical protein
MKAPNGDVIEARTSYWYTGLNRPTYNLKSNSGEHDLKVSSNKVILLGGLFSACLAQTIFDLVRGYHGEGPLTIEMPTGGIFESTERNADYSEIAEKTNNLRNLFPKDNRQKSLYNYMMHMTYWGRFNANIDLYLEGQFVNRIHAGPADKRIIINLR